jgi:predicted Zn-dependent protease with MMP-like domain
MAAEQDPTDLASDIAALDAFELALEHAIATIPAPFAAQLDSVAIVVEDRPTAAQLASVDAHGLYGLYQGVPRTTFGADLAAVPSKITLFRDTLERRYPDPDDLARAVEETLHHEVAHHLGISDARLAELKRGGRPRSRA